MLRLERLADLCAQVEGPEMADALIAILDDDAPSVRVQAAEALVDVGFERYAEVARAIERALARGEHGPAMQELPWVLCEIAEPSARPLIARFLQEPGRRRGRVGGRGAGRARRSGGDQGPRPLVDDPRPVSLAGLDEEEDESSSDEEIDGDARRTGARDDRRRSKRLRGEEPRGQ